MDALTFADIKERLEELGAVDHNGINFKKLNSIKPPWYTCLRCGQPGPRRSWQPAWS